VRLELLPRHSRREDLELVSQTRRP
jgi:hypothetical protein